MSTLSQLSRPLSSSWAPIALAISSLAPILGLPILVGALVDRLGFSAAAAGYIASSDLAGLCLGSVVTSAIARHVSWRNYVGAAIIACIGINISCAYVSEFWPILALRLAAGAASGAVYSSALALLARSDDATRDFSLLTFLQVVANALILAVFPRVVSAWGLAGLFVTIALALAATFLVVPLLPGVSAGESGAARDARPAGASSARRRQGTSILPALCLSAIALFYMTIGSYWAYAERMGIQFGLTPDVVHELLTIGVLLSAAGCLLAFWLSRRIGQSRPLLVALMTLSVTLLLHAALPRPGMFVIALAIQQLCWNFVDIFQLGTLAVIDPTGRAAALVPAAQGVSLAAGPAAAGALLATGSGYAAVLILGGIAAALAAAVYAVVHQRYRLAEAPGRNF